MLNKKLMEIEKTYKIQRLLDKAYYMFLGGALYAAMTIIF